MIEAELASEFAQPLVPAIDEVNKNDSSTDNQKTISVKFVPFIMDYLNEGIGLEDG